MGRVTLVVSAKLEVERKCASCARLLLVRSFHFQSSFILANHCRWSYHLWPDPLPLGLVPLDHYYFQIISPALLGGSSSSSQEASAHYLSFVSFGQSANLSPSPVGLVESECNDCLKRLEAAAAADSTAIGHVIMSDKMDKIKGKRPSGPLIRTLFLLSLIAYLTLELVLYIVGL